MKSGWSTLSLAVVCGIAQAQPGGYPTADADLCRTTINNPELAIRHCTIAIESRKANSEMLAKLHVLRGVEWAAKGDYERAIADHTTALKLDAKTNDANYFRAVAWSHKGEFERAIADFDIAAKLKPDDPVVYHARAIELAVKGDYARAIADFDRTLQLDPKTRGVHFARGRTLFYMSEFARAAHDLETAFKAQPNIYTALWLFLARKRGGAVDADERLERETRGIRAGWPAPLIALFMGRTDVNSVIVSAATDDPARRREMRCEADYYVAQSYIIKGERPRAQALLREVQRSCARNLLEYEAATAELRRVQ
jgi:lipoprotein NlpI